jgi:hypothetical protein
LFLATHSQNNSGDSKLLYLAIMGEIFDVTRGEKVRKKYFGKIKYNCIKFFCRYQHYGPGQPYHNFVAVDASRAFITGEFDAKHGKSNALDHVLSLSPR